MRVFNAIHRKFSEMHASSLVSLCNSHRNGACVHYVNAFDQIFSNRPDTWLPQSLAGGQGPYLRSLDHLGRSPEAKNCKIQKKEGVTDRRTDRWTDKAECRVA